MNPTSRWKWWLLLGNRVGWAPRPAIALLNDVKAEVPSGSSLLAAICGGSLSLGILLICPASRDNFFPVAQRQVSALAEGSKGPALLPLQPQSASLAALLGTPASRAAPSCHNAVRVCGL